ncbi:MAG: NDP-sugar synthase, partial [Acidimicrobiales bacterium]
MDAVVLVGGEGTRLRPLTYEIPKQMLPVVGRPMIAHVVEWLAGHGVDRAVLSLGYRADAFVEAFPTNQLSGVALEYIVEPEPLDTAGAIRFAADKAGVSGTFLVLNGDVLTEFDASALVEFHVARSAEASIALTPVADPSNFGVVPTDEAGRVIAFIEKPPLGEAPTNLINAGIYVLETSVLDRIPSGRRVSIERETFPELVSSGRLYALASDAYWLDTGRPHQYLQAQLDILWGRRVSLPPA